MIGLPSMTIEPSRPASNPNPEPPRSVYDLPDDVDVMKG